MFVKQTLVASFLLITMACNQAPTGTDVKSPGGTDNGGGGGNGQQTITAVAPRYVATQFQAGQWIEWTRTFGSKRECRILKVSAVDVTTITFEIRNSDCTTADTNSYQRMIFNKITGEITSHLINSGGVWEKPERPLTSIYPLVQGDDEKVKHMLFQHDSVNIEKAKFPVFSLDKESSRLYLNLPGHAFHAYALRWVDKTASGTWTMDILRSSPAIPISSN